MFNVEDIILLYCKFFKTARVTINSLEDDDNLLKNGCVDYIGFSYYNSGVVTTRKDAEMTLGNGIKWQQILT